MITAHDAELRDAFTRAGSMITTQCSRCGQVCSDSQRGPIVALLEHWGAHGGVPAVREQPQ